MKPRSLLVLGLIAATILLLLASGVYWFDCQSRWQAEQEAERNRLQWRQAFDLDIEKLEHGHEEFEKGIREIQAGIDELKKEIEEEKSRETPYN